MFYFQYWISTEVVKIFTWVVWDGPLSRSLSLSHFQRFMEHEWSWKQYCFNYMYTCMYIFFFVGEIFKHFSFSVTYHSFSLCRLLNNLAASFHVTPLFHFISRSNCRHYFFTNSWHNSHKPHASCFHQSLHHITNTENMIGPKKIEFECWIQITFWKTKNLYRQLVKQIRV